MIDIPHLHFNAVTIFITLSAFVLALYFSNRIRLLRSQLKERLLAAQAELDKSSNQHMNDFLYRCEFEHIILNITNRVMLLKTENIDQFVTDSLQDVAEFLHADSCYIMNISPDQKIADLNHLWERKDLNLDMSIVQHMPIKHIYWRFERLLQKQVLNISNINDAIKEQHASWKHVKKHGVSALLETPLVIDERTVAFIGLSSVKIRQWSEDDITLLKIIGQILINSIAQKKWAHDLEHAKETAEEASRAKGDFLAKMSHEIRTPMNGVLGISELLSYTELSEKQSYYNKMIINSGKTLLAIINDILDFSKIDSEKLILEHTDFCLDEIFSNTLAINKIQTDDKSIRLLGFYHPQVPIHFVGDPHRIQQIINNLISNAVKFTHEGGIDFIVEGSIQDTKYFSLIIKIKDTGIGMSEQQLQHLFKAFEQAESSTSRTYGGSGLGLSISKRLVELMNGNIQVETQPGIGSEFTVSLPLEINHKKEQRRLSSFSALQGLNILLIESNPEHILRVSKILSYWGLTVTACTSISQSLVDMKDTSHVFDLVLINLQFLDDVNTASMTQLFQIKAPILCVPQLKMDAALLQNIGHRCHMLPNTPTITQIAHTLIMAAQGRKLDADNARAHLATFSHLHLLIVDDNDVNLTVVSTLAKKLGLTITTAVNGQEALNLLDGNIHSFDGILMDCEMPVMDGYTTTQHIRQQEIKGHLQALPIIALTAHALPEHYTRCIRSGMNDVLTKPINMDRLSNMLLKWFDESERPQNTLAEPEHHL